MQLTLEQLGIWGAHPPLSRKSVYRVQSPLHIPGSSMSVVPPDPQFRILRVNKLQTVESCSIYYRETLCMSGPAQFNPVLFKGQLYFTYMNLIFMTTERDRYCYHPDFTDEETEGQRG